MAVKFTAASSHYYHKTGITTFPITGYPFTLMGWHNESGGTGFQEILTCTDTSTGDSYYMIQGNNGTRDLRIVARGTGEAERTNAGSTTLNTDQWYHVVGVFRSATDRELYLDGVSEATGTLSATFPGASTTDTITIGAFDQSGPFAFSDSSHCECVMWDSEITLNEIKAMANGVSPLKVQRGSMVGYWPLWSQSTGGTDLSGVGNNLTKNNTPATVNHPSVGRSVTMPYAPQRRVRSTDDALILDRIIPS